MTHRVMPPIVLCPRRASTGGAGGKAKGRVFKSGSKGLGYYPAHSKAETEAPSVSTFDIDDDDDILSETYALLKQQCGEQDRTYNRIDQWVLVAEHIDIYRSDSSNPSITQGTEYSVYDLTKFENGKLFSYDWNYEWVGVRISTHRIAHLSTSDLLPTYSKSGTTLPWAASKSELRPTHYCAMTMSRGGSSGNKDVIVRFVAGESPPTLEFGDQWPQPLLNLLFTKHQFVKRWLD